MYNSIDKNCNILAQYEIIGRVPNGTSIVGYVIKNRTNGEIQILQKGIVEQLALCKNIYNANAQIYNNVVNLKGINCKLSQLPRYTADGSIICDKETKRYSVEPFLRIVGRVQRQRIICGYIIEYKDREDKIIRKRVDKDKTLELARAGYIINAKAQLNNGELMLRGIDEDLGLLKTFKDI